MSLQAIKEPVLREMLQAAYSVEARAQGRQRGFALMFRFGRAEKILVTSRGNIRMFASLDTAGAFMKEVGIPRFDVDMSGYKPGRLRAPRPDRAEALKQTRTRLRQQQLGF